MNKLRQRPNKALQLARIESLSHDGRGIARLDGKTTFIQGALEGEEISFQYTRKKRDYDEGVMVSVISRSESRVDPPCSHYNLCGGCSLQHLAIDRQIEVKQALFLDILWRIGHCRPETLLTPLTAQSMHYRNKARFSVRYVEKKQAILLGFREKNNPRYITEISGCPIMRAEVDAQIINLRLLIHSFSNSNSIKQVEVAAGDKQIALILRHLAPFSLTDLEKIKKFGEDTGFYIFLQSAGPESVSLFYPIDVSPFLSYRLERENLQFQFHPNDFIQVNAEINQLMVTRAKDLLSLTKDDNVLDLFCGLGNFSLVLAKYCNKVIGVEGSEMMVDRAQMNAKANFLGNADFFCANLDAEGSLSCLELSQFTKMLLDPPRSGALEVVKQITKIGSFERIVYVSCNPATFARDCDILVNHNGYKLLKAGVMDMFAHTTHVEAIALFEKG